MGIFNKDRSLDAPNCQYEKRPSSSGYPTCKVATDLSYP